MRIWAMLQRDVSEVQNFRAIACMLTRAYFVTALPEPVARCTHFIIVSVGWTWDLATTQEVWEVLMWIKG
jgi:hypothetical protein